MDPEKLRRYDVTTVIFPVLLRGPEPRARHKSCNGKWLDTHSNISYISYKYKYIYIYVDRWILGIYSDICIYIYIRIYIYIYIRIYIYTLTQIVDHIICITISDIVYCIWYSIQKESAIRFTGNTNKKLDASLHEHIHWYTYSELPETHHLYIYIYIYIYIKCGFFLDTLL